MLAWSNMGLLLVIAIGAILEGLKLMYWVNEKERRYYHAAVVRDLFGGLLVVRTTGGMGSRRGRVMSYPVADEIEADEMLSSVACTRIRHGYTEKTFTSVDQ